VRAVFVRSSMASELDVRILFVMFTGAVALFLAGSGPPAASNGHWLSV